MSLRWQRFSLEKISYSQTNIDQLATAAITGLFGQGKRFEMDSMLLNCGNH